jgi:ketosteroid isomerase-like protein
MRPLKLVRSACLIVSAATAIGCKAPAPAASTPDTTAIKAGVDSAAARLLSALRADSPDSLMALMADDVIIMPPHEKVLNGKAAVNTWYREFVGQMKTSSLDVTDRELFIDGNYATEVAQFQWTLVSLSGGPKIVEHGSYMQLWHRQSDGRWMFSREVWNNMAPPAK